MDYDAVATSEIAPKARAAALRALEIDPDTPTCWWDRHAHLLDGRIVPGHPTQVAVSATWLVERTSSRPVASAPVLLSEPRENVVSDSALAIITEESGPKGLGKRQRAE